MNSVIFLLYSFLDRKTIQYLITIYPLINLYPVVLDNAIGFLIPWIVIYPMDSSIKLLNNRGEVDSL